MQFPSANAVHALLQRGLSLGDRLEAGEPVQWDLECGALKKMLAAFDTQAEEPSDPGNELGFVFSEHGSPEERGQLTRATIRYALACWLDEWFSFYLDQPSHRSERSFETDLFGSQEGNVKFWDEARYAETRGDLDALEVMYLCVMLGFRGNRRDKPEQLDTWAKRTRARLEQAEPTWTVPASLETTEPALMHDDLPFRRMAFSVLLAVSLMLPLVLVLLWRRPV